MNLRTLFLGRPSAPPSRRHLVIGCFGLVLLGLMVFVYVVAITIFLWGDIVRPKVAVVLAFLWVISAIAIGYIAKGLRHHLERLHSGAASGPVSR